MARGTVIAGWLIRKASARRIRDRPVRELLGCSQLGLDAWRLMSKRCGIGLPWRSTMRAHTTTHTCVLPLTVMRYPRIKDITGNKLRAISFRRTIKLWSHSHHVLAAPQGGR